MGIFHKVIIASVCCIVLFGCGHKTKPVYIEKRQEAKNEKMKSQKIKNQELKK
jgi:hypothetical protein